MTAPSESLFYPVKNNLTPDYPRFFFNVISKAKSKQTRNYINYLKSSHFPKTAARGQASIENDLTECLSGMKVKKLGFHWWY